MFRLGIALAYYGFRVITINSYLSNFNRKFKALSLRYRTQKQRMEAVEDFTKGKYDIIIGTDILARGMNFPNVITTQ
jgi:superfamily II DNA/RNA helicase